MGFGEKIWGSIRAELVSADILGAMTALRNAGCSIWELDAPDPLTIRFSVGRRDWKSLSQLMQKRGESLRVLSTDGYFWQLVSLRKRPILVFGMLLLMAMSLWLPSRILFVQIEGNVSVADRQILEAASQCGIRFGSSRRLVRSEKVKNNLLERMPSLSWAGVNTYGCRAVITVRERSTPESSEVAGAVSSIVATQDGVIQQMVVLRGSAACKVGQTVQAGQVLISGYTDCGLTIQATEAKGEIFAQTNRNIYAVCPTVGEKRGQQTESARKFSLIIGKKRINFSNSSGISGAGCAKIYEEKYVMLPGGFLLPVAIAIETWTFYETEPETVFFGENVLQNFCRPYLLERMCAGSILESQEDIRQLEGLVSLQGSYQCYEMIGITRIEENIPNYGKSG